MCSEARRVPVGYRSAGIRGSGSQSVVAARRLHVCSKTDESVEPKRLKTVSHAQASAQLAQECVARAAGSPRSPKHSSFEVPEPRLFVVVEPDGFCLTNLHHICHPSKPTCH